MTDNNNYLGYRNWNRIRNSGDAITSDILTILSGLPVKAVLPSSSHILGVGSIIFLANEHSHVWGSGILNPEMPILEAANSTFHALRGKKTYAFLRNKGLQVPDVPLGDPGIFAREVCEQVFSSNREIKFRAAFVPHHASIGHAFFRNIAKVREYVVIDMLDNSLRPLQQMMQSEVVISQSLHGLIYAESIGKPNLWISDRHDEIWRFKFEDWFSTTAKPQSNPEAFTTDLEELFKKATMHESTIDKDSLADSLPVEECVFASAPVMSVESCRHYNPAVFFIDSLLGGQLYNRNDATGLVKIDAISKKIFPCVWKLFKQWAERSYCFIVPTDESINFDQEKLLNCVRFLDENVDVDFAFVVPKERCGNQSIPYETIRCSVDLIKDNPVAGGALLIRPDSFQLTNMFVTLCI